MTYYTVSWDGPSAEEPDRGNEVIVSTVAELDAVLDRVVSQAETENLPYAVQVHTPDAAGSVMIGVGHPRFSFVDWLMPKGHRRYAHQPGIAGPDEPIAFDMYGNWHEHTPAESRVTPETARQAAREYLHTGERPTCVQWNAD